jgi:hypothetical protein
MHFHVIVNFIGVVVTGHVSFRGIGGAMREIDDISIVDIGR